MISKLNEKKHFLLSKSVQPLEQPLELHQDATEYLRLNY